MPHCRGGELSVRRMRERAEHPGPVGGAARTAALVALALLRSLDRGRVRASAAGSSDGGGEFGERCGDAEPARGVVSELVGPWRRFCMKACPAMIVCAV